MSSNPRPLLLGEAPSRAGDRFYMVPLSGRPAQRLLRFAGIKRTPDTAAYWDLIEYFDTMNAIERYADAYPWIAETSRRAQDRLLHRLREDRNPVVVALGRKAASALEAPNQPWGLWAEAYAGPVGFSYVILPHPSGRNHLYNDPAMRELAGRVLREAVERAKRVSTQESPLESGLT